MTTQPQPAKVAELQAEHEALKEQTAALRREHNRLQTEGGTREEHIQHSLKLRTKIRELEQHVARLKRLCDHER